MMTHSAKETGQPKKQWGVGIGVDWGVGGGGGLDKIENKGVGNIGWVCIQ